MSIKSEWINKRIPLFSIILTELILLNLKNVVNCGQIQIEDFCDGPICEFLFYKPEEDEIITDKQFTRKLIYFRNSIIPIIPSEILQVYPEIKQLSLTGVHVKELPHNMNSESLEFLYLASNKIRTVENDVFKSLPSLKYLWLNDNHIESLGAFAFDNMENLLLLELSNNEIVEIPDMLFKNTPKLTSLFLNNNQIQILQQGLFDNNPNLYQLNLDNNKILTIGENIFKTVKSLNTLDISRNPMLTLNLVDANIERLISNSSSIIKLSITGTVKKLAFYRTPIRKIEISQANSVQGIILNECYQRDLKILEPFAKIKVLDISSNPLIKLDKNVFEKFKILKILNIQNCGLTEIDGLFDYLKEMRVLDISNNKIQEINLDSVRPMRNLKNISITENQWSCCSLKPFIAWLNLRSVSFKEEPKIEDSNMVYLDGINCIV